MNQVLLGALVAACLTAGLLFLRFWRDTRDRLFVMFAAAFWILGLHWSLLASVSLENEFRPLFYGLRLVAFLIILAAIADKNRS